MRPFPAALLACFLLLAATAAPATTWNEPWHEKVVQNADGFVKGKVVAVDAASSFTIEVTAHLAGEKTPAQVVVQGFYGLSLTSTISRPTGELGFHFAVGDEGYFFLKKGEGETWAIATPTTGFASIKEGKVYATYRHSYHQALIEPEMYEPTQAAIFEHLHGRPWNKEVVGPILAKHLALPPADYAAHPKDPEVAAAFFRQHVALECFYHLGDAKDAALLEPFLAAPFFHIQISAARALSRIDTPEARARLLQFVTTPDRDAFAKVMAVWGLRRLKARDSAPALEKYAAEAPAEESGFGGNLMDPRIGTAFPDSVKAAIEELLAEWKKEGGEGK